MSGTQILGSRSIQGWAGWDVIGSGNFNGDDSPDLLIRHHSEGWHGVWYMGGAGNAEIVGSQGITVWDGWDLKASGDFNGDGRTDLVVQHQTEDWFGILYLNDDQQVVSSQSINGWADWNIIGASDLNNDGQTDLLIEHQSQPWNGVWYMEGNQIVSSSGLSPWAGWEITG